MFYGLRRMQWSHAYHAMFSGLVHSGSQNLGALGVCMILSQSLAFHIFLDYAIATRNKSMIYVLIVGGSQFRTQARFLPKDAL
jgi:hypothetical protein